MNLFLFCQARSWSKKPQTGNLFNFFIAVSEIQGGSQEHWCYFAYQSQLLKNARTAFYHRLKMQKLSTRISSEMCLCSRLLQVRLLLCSICRIIQAEFLHAHSILKNITPLQKSLLQLRAQHRIIIFTSFSMCNEISCVNKIPLVVFFKLCVLVSFSLCCCISDILVLF